MGSGLEGRVRQFSEATGVVDRVVLEHYARADLDGSGKISVGELREFQSSVMRRFVWGRNATVLRPEEFVRQGVGDCDDFAAYTVGMLRFWGVEAYVGEVRNRVDDRVGHAVALVFMGQERIEGLRQFAVYEGQGTVGAKVGRYLVVDYGEVGGLAAGTGMTDSARLYKVWKLEEFWGQRL